MRSLSAGLIKLRSSRFSDNLVSKYNMESNKWRYLLSNFGLHISPLTQMNTWATQTHPPHMSTYPHEHICKTYILTE